MPWIPMYLVDADVKQLCAMLNDDPDIALVVPDGVNRWKAQRKVPKLPNGEHALWHIPSGPIELESKDYKANPKIVRNPFKGWRARIPEFERDHGGVPWFGPGPLGIFRLTIRRTAGTKRDIFSPMTARPWTAPANEVIGLSTFGWIGNHYSIIGYKAPKATELYWNTLRRRIAKAAVKIPSDGPLGGKYKSIWAFPAALAEIKRGRKRADNP
jgi:hypothetical protein